MQKYKESLKPPNVFLFFSASQNEKPAAPCCEGLAGFGRREDERGVQRCQPGVAEGLCQGAAGEAKRGGNSRENADGDLNEGFPSVLFHSDRCLRVCVWVNDSRLLNFAVQKLGELSGNSPWRRSGVRMPILRRRLRCFQSLLDCQCLRGWCRQWCRSRLRLRCRQSRASRSECRQCRRRRIP